MTAEALCSSLYTRVFHVHEGRHVECLVELGSHKALACACWLCRVLCRHSSGRSRDWGVAHGVFVVWGQPHSERWLGQVCDLRVAWVAHVVMHLIPAKGCWACCLEGAGAASS